MGEFVFLRRGAGAPRLFSNRITAVLQSAGLQTPLEWRSVTHPITSVCLSLFLALRATLLLQICSSLIHSLLLSISFFLLWLFIPSPSLSCLTLTSLSSASLSPRLNFIPSSPLLFFFLPWLSPSLSFSLPPFPSLDSTHTSHLSFYLLADLGISISSWAETAWSRHRNVFTEERWRWTNVNMRGKLWNECKAALIITFT